MLLYVAGATKLGKLVRGVCLCVRQFSPPSPTPFSAIPRTHRIPRGEYRFKAFDVVGVPLPPGVRQIGWCFA